MAFQGQQGPDMISLALNLMQMRRENEFNERKFKLEEAKLAQQAQLDAIQAQRDQAEWILKMNMDQLKLDDAMSTRERAMAPTMNAANDERLSNPERQASANQLIRDIEAQIAIGRDPEMVGGNIGAESASMKAKALSEAPNLDWEYDSAGNKRRVIVGPGGQMTPVPGAAWVPPRAGVTVNVGGEDGLDLNQVVAASRDERRDFVARMEPFEAIRRAQSSIKNVRAMAGKDGLLPQQASQIIASDAMAALRPEALNEGDVARLTAVGLWNKINARLGLPPQMTVGQLDTLSRMINDKAKDAAPRRKALIRESIYRAKQFGFDPRLIIGEYADDFDGSSGSPKTPKNEKPASRPKRGSRRPAGVLSPAEAAAEGLPE